MLGACNGAVEGARYLGSLCQLARAACCLHCTAAQALESLLGAAAAPATAGWDAPAGIRIREMCSSVHVQEALPGDCCVTEAAGAFIYTGRCWAGATCTAASQSASMIPVVGLIRARPPAPCQHQMHSGWPHGKMASAPPLKKSMTTLGRQHCCTERDHSQQHVRTCCMPELCMRAGSSNTCMPPRFPPPSP